VLGREVGGSWLVRDCRWCMCARLSWRAVLVGTEVGTERLAVGRARWPAQDSFGTKGLAVCAGPDGQSRTVVVPGSWEHDAENLERQWRCLRTSLLMRARLARCMDVLNRR
jgi:hypothetical protein